MKRNGHGLVKSFERSRSDGQSPPTSWTGRSEKNKMLDFVLQCGWKSLNIGKEGRKCNWGWSCEAGILRKERFTTS